MSAMPELRALSHTEIQLRLQNLPHWSYTPPHLQRSFTTSGWKSSLMLVNMIGHLAEVAWHHPDITTCWNKVQVRLSTHDVDGISDRDFELAHKIEEVLGWRPDLGNGALEGTPQDERFAYIKYDP
jgi:4a-hydroxytetrahydrobiopterin dehydratase